MKRLFLSLALASAALMATDYSSMNLDELNALKGSIPQEDREAYKAAKQSKMLSLTPEERAEKMGQKGLGKGSQNGQKLRDGSGSGGMNKGLKGGGN